MKIKWKVSEKPTGQYRSFFKRQWPTAEFENGKSAATLICEDKYEPRNVKSGDHSEISVRVFLHGNRSKKRGLPTGVMKVKAKTLDEAKELVEIFYKNNPKHVPE
jgi:hypothetical protein